MEKLHPLHLKNVNKSIYPISKKQFCELSNYGSQYPVSLSCDLWYVSSPILHDSNIFPEGLSYKAEIKKYDKGDKKFVVILYDIICGRLDTLEEAHQLASNCLHAKDEGFDLLDEFLGYKY